jgi:hypothetical protein
MTVRNPGLADLDMDADGRGLPLPAVFIEHQSNQRRNSSQIVCRKRTDGHKLKID